MRCFPSHDQQQKMYLKKNLSAGRSQSKIKAIMSIGRQEYEKRLLREEIETLKASHKKEISTMKKSYEEKLTESEEDRQYLEDKADEITLDNRRLERKIGERDMEIRQLKEYQSQYFKTSVILAREMMTPAMWFSFQSNFDNRVNRLQALTQYVPTKPIDQTLEDIFIKFSIKEGH